MPPLDLSPSMTEQAYKASGVDLDAAQAVKQSIKHIVASTHGPQVLDGVGAFGAAYQLSGNKEPVLVSSTDGVGTKLKIASMMGRFDSIGEDVVNACVNDVIVCGASPLFFLDYIAMSKLAPETIEVLVGGMARACREVECALVGGETAETPGIYAGGGFDVAGFVVGVVEKREMIDTSTIREGDILLGLPSNGLHTNGYSLVRHALGLDDDPSPLWEFRPELDRTLGDALLVPHRSYFKMLRPVFTMLKGMAHITGGGLIENLPRALPEGLAARLDRSAWRVPPIFPFLQQRGGVSGDEMYRVFNMGLGMVLLCDDERVGEVVSQVPEAVVVGEVIRATDDRRVVV